MHVNQACLNLSFYQTTYLTGRLFDHVRQIEHFYDFFELLDNNAIDAIDMKWRGKLRRRANILTINKYSSRVHFLQLKGEFEKPYKGY